MNRFKGITSFLAALSLFCLLSDSAEARLRRGRNQRSNQCCTPAPSCGCGVSDYEPSGTYDEHSAMKPDMANQNYGENSSNNSNRTYDQNSPNDSNRNANQNSGQNSGQNPANNSDRNDGQNSAANNSDRNGGQNSAADENRTKGQDSDQNFAPENSDVPLRPGSTN